MPLDKTKSKATTQMSEDYVRLVDTILREQIIKTTRDCSLSIVRAVLPKELEYSDKEYQEGYKNAQSDFAAMLITMSERIPQLPEEAPKIKKRNRLLAGALPCLYGYGMSTLFLVLIMYHAEQPDYIKFLVASIVSLGLAVLGTVFWLKESRGK